LGDHIENNEIGRKYSMNGGQKGRIEGRRPLGRLWRRWDDNTEMKLREVRWGHALD
jgi:hypothetical protein